LLEVEVLQAPQIRYTQDNQTPVAEMAVRFDGLRPDDPPGQIQVVGWGSLAQDLQNRVQVGQRLVLEGRLRMNTVSRPDGVKEKRAEFTLSRLHPIGAGSALPDSGAAHSPFAAAVPSSAPAAPRSSSASAPAPIRRQGAPAPAPARAAAAAPRPDPEPPVWNASPLVADPEGFADDDDIPF
jgi:single-stranded DNA-binding protein